MFTSLSSRRRPGRTRGRARSAFTLIEIMIVVLIIGILLGIAVPNFVKARESSRAKSCVANLKQIDSGKEQYAMDQKISGSTAIAMSNLVGATAYIKSTPVCPSAGAYTINTLGVNPTCSVSATSPNNPHILP